MSETKDYLIILLRKIYALSAPGDFDATEDTSEEILMDGLFNIDPFFYDVLKDFVSSLKTVIVTKKEQHSNQANNSAIDSIVKELKTNITILKNECKSQHINIDYELEQLLNNGNIIEE
ncbi:MAG: hypothetical protein DRI86_13165 [Bacteroidetes bacterium]|nr:MAG: hypothetical protein DRI86_13165 [Bacteroidota bacterium]